MSRTNGYVYNHPTDNPRSISPIDRSNKVYTQQSSQQQPIVKPSPIRVKPSPIRSQNTQRSVMFQSPQPQINYSQIQPTVLYQQPTTSNVPILHQSVQPLIHQPLLIQQPVQQILQQQQPLQQIIQQPVLHQQSVIQQQPSVIQQQPSVVQQQPSVVQQQPSVVQQQPSVRQSVRDPNSNKGYEKVINNYKIEIQNLRTINDQKENKIQELINENHNLNKLLANADDNRHYISRIDELERDMQQKQNVNNNQKIQLQHQISQQNQIINELKQQLEKYHDDDLFKRNHLGQQVAKYQSLIFLLTLENDRLHDVIKNQYDELSEIDLETQKIKYQQGMLNRNCPNCMQKGQYYENELKQLDQKNQLLLSDNKALHQDLITMQQKTNYLQSELDKRGVRFNQSKMV